MITRSVDDLIDTLTADARPVVPLDSPLKRALGLLGGFALVSTLALVVLGDLDQLSGRYTGREKMLFIEMGAMLTTAVLAIVGAFFLSIPGCSRRWLVAPLPPFLLWLFLSGAGCYQELVRSGMSRWEIGHSLDCLIFVLATSAGFAAPLIFRLSRASPIDPRPVALLGGLGTAALAAFLLQFFHPFAVTFVDLSVHVAAIALVVGVTAILDRRVLLPV